MNTKYPNLNSFYVGILFKVKNPPSNFFNWKPFCTYVLNIDFHNICFCGPGRTRTYIKWLTVTRNNLYTTEPFWWDPRESNPVLKIFSLARRPLTPEPHIPFVGTCRFLSRHFPRARFIIVYFPTGCLKPTLCGPYKNRTYKGLLTLRQIYSLLSSPPAQTIQLIVPRERIELPLVACKTTALPLDDRGICTSCRIRTYDFNLVRVALWTNWVKEAIAIFFYDSTSFSPVKKYQNGLSSFPRRESNPAPLVKSQLPTPVCYEGISTAEGDRTLASW